jgi:mRNA interferase MazF
MGKGDAEMRVLKRGDIYYADLSPVKGSEQGGHRPVLVIQNDVGNKHAPTTIVAVITSRHTKAKLPTHIWLNAECGLPKESMVECEQVRTLDKTRLKDFMGQVSQEVMKEIDLGLKISFGLK